MAPAERGHRQPEESFAQEMRRRVSACEAHLSDLEGRLNARGVFTGTGMAAIFRDHCDLVLVIGDLFPGTMHMDSRCVKMPPPHVLTAECSPAGDDDHVLTGDDEPAPLLFHGGLQCPGHTAGKPGPECSGEIPDA